jgi:hypothetical protein
MQLPSLDQRVVVDVRGPSEWIVGVPAGGRSLHVYRLAPADWLVSEVGRGSEGRGADLKQALAALSAGASYPEWWEAVAGALEGDGEPQRPRG